MLNQNYMFHFEQGNEEGKFLCRKRKSKKRFPDLDPIPPGGYHAR